MKDFTPEQKHEILMEYQRYSRTHSFAALASRHDVNGGGRTIQNWYKRWEGIIASLQHRTGAGRPRILTPEEVEHNVEQPIREANRRAQQVRYSQIAEHLREDTGKSVSDRTVRRIGEEELGGKLKRGQKRQLQSVSTYIYNTENINKP
jgi:transposase